MSATQIGGTAFDEHGSHLPQSCIDLCDQSDAILFGSAGGPVEAQHEPKWKDCRGTERERERSQLPPAARPT